MLKTLKPVSDLQRVQRFDDYDLTANRSGTLSVRQRWRFIGTRLAEHAIGALTVMFFATLLIDTFSRLLIPNMIAPVIVLIFLVTLISFVLSVRPALQQNVLSVKGVLRKDFAIPLDSISVEEIAIGPQRFFIRYELYDVLDEDAVYQAYYLKRGQRGGGNLLLSVELITAAPSDD